jgi:hypothetical protein
VCVCLCAETQAYFACNPRYIDFVLAYLNKTVHLMPAYLLSRVCVCGVCGVCVVCWCVCVVCVCGVCVLCVYGVCVWCVCGVCVCGVCGVYGGCGVCDVCACGVVRV